MAAESIVSLIMKDHENVKSLFSRLDMTSSEKLGDLFCELRETLVRHEVAEELTLYPLFRSEVPGADAIADARIAEQSEAEEKLQKLEKMEPEAPTFIAALTALRADVLAHAEKEQLEVLSRLSEHATPDKLNQAGARYARAVQSAPTHPHPHAPDTPPGNLVMGPVAVLADRMRDAMKKAS